MRKIVILLITIFVCMISKNAYAITNNNIGRELTQEEYNTLKSLGLRDYMIEDLSIEDFYKYSVQTVENQVIEVKYYKEIEVPSLPIKNGPKYINIEISEEEYNSNDDNNTRASVHETSYKRLEIIMTQLASPYTNRLVTAYLNWKKVPSTKSHDVFALYATNGKLVNTYSATQRMRELAPSKNVECKLQDTVYHTTNYSSTYNGWNILPDNAAAPLLGSKGEGVSMQLDTTITACSYDLGITYGKIKGYEFSFLTQAAVGNNGTATIKASYQHAQSSVSFNASKAYTYSTSGFGGVINFTNPTTASKYDQMGGVSATL